MRGLRSFVALLVILIGLGAYLYFVESKRTPGDDAEKRDKVFTAESDKIDGMSIRSESGERTTLRKSGTAWQIVAPVTAPADAGEISSLTSNLASLEVQRVVDENAADLKEFGLEPARIEVSFTSGGQTQTLRIGQKTPPGSDLYARTGDDKKVFLIPSYVESTFNRGTFDLRDKAVLKVERDSVDAIQIQAGASPVALAKQNDAWQLTQPVEAPADFGSVSGLLNRLTSAQMKAVEPGADANAAKYGFAKPQATVQIGGGSSRAVLVLGATAGEGAVYARDQARPDVFTVESSLLDELKKGASEYRQKDLFDARAFNTTRVEIARDGQTRAFEKIKEKDKDGKETEKWRQVAPETKDVDGTTVESLLSSLTSARAESFVMDTRKAGLDTPALTATLKYDEGRKEDRVTFARAGADAYASRAGMPGAARIDSATFEAIVKALDAVK